MHLIIHKPLNTFFLESFSGSWVRLIYTQSYLSNIITRSNLTFKIELIKAEMHRGTSVRLAQGALTTPSLLYTWHTHTDTHVHTDTDPQYKETLSIPLSAIQRHVHAAFNITQMKVHYLG